MTDHEMVLLRAAVEAGAIVSGLEGEAPTLADALTALLTDLGADVPEWPSEERVAELRRFYPVTVPVADLPLPELLALRGVS